MTKTRPGGYEGRKGNDMAEYIERERLRESLKCHHHPTDQEYESDRQWAVGYNAGLDRALHSLHYAPAADVAPVVHGRWESISFEVFGLNWKCSNCDSKEFLKYNYCPNCGARMDGE